MGKKQILIVDDEPDIRELLELTLGRMDLETRAAANLEEANYLLKQFDFDLCLTDMRLPDGNGIELVREIQNNHPDLPVAVITAYGNMETAVAALKAGAFDFISKPVDLNDLRNIVRTALKLSKPEKADNKDKRAPADSASRMLGKSATIDAVRKLIEKLARGQAPVYIGGESGTGKELAARLIHDLGPRADRPFVPVNCGAIPEQLMESEFFGHKKGSFTGASSDKEGLFQAADGGTLFLDEVGDLPLHMQVKLLRAIQEKTIRPVGTQSETRVDVRILSATHKDLHELVQTGKFRQDLYYRLNVIELTIPSLRERREDIAIIAEAVAARLAETHGIKMPTLAAAAIDALSQYDFPGNVRELENILERAITLCEGGEITRADLQLRQSGSSNAVFDLAAAGEPGRLESETLDDYLERIERQSITDALEKSGQNKTAAAKLLGITFRALRYKLEKLGID
ncbi:MAG: sigma-54 dependent transcriptional regulator [Gammaproteobacteria bacterium]|nr:sigma-54 dependent transcriptional regulator [Gammaproteobacteria bacterium]